jgi:mRNA interferase RelE/StbE
VADYTITFSRSARKELEGLDAKIVKQIFPKIEALAERPRPLMSRKIQGEKYLWRIRVGNYRVIYAVHDNECTIDIIAVRHRREAYKF